MPALSWSARGSLPPTYACFVTASRQVLRRYRDVPGHLWHLRTLRRQWREADGLLGFAFAARPRDRTFWTISAWVDPDAAAIFAKSQASSGEDFGPQIVASIDVSWSCLAEELPVPGPKPAAASPLLPDHPSFYGGGMTGQQDSEPSRGSEPAEDLVEQGRDGRGTGWPGRARWGPRWSPRWSSRWPPRLGRTAKVTAGLVAAALTVGLAGGYLGGYQAGDAHGRSQVPKPRPSPASEVSSFGLAETGSQCSTILGQGLQVGVEVVNGSPGPIRLGALTARFPRGGLTVTGAAWGPCGTLPYPHVPGGSLLPVGASTWLSVTVAAATACPDGLPVEYVASFSQSGQTYTVALPGYVELGTGQAKGCPAA